LSAHRSRQDVFRRRGAETTRPISGANWDFLQNAPNFSIFAGLETPE
jgi:hypothetical protein